MHMINKPILMLTMLMMLVVFIKKISSPTVMIPCRPIQLVEGIENNINKMQNKPMQN